MSLISSRYTYYSVECDRCFKSEYIITGDSGMRGRLRKKEVSNARDAIAALNFHKTKYELLCNKCFKDFRKENKR